MRRYKVIQKGKNSFRVKIKGWLWWSYVKECVFGGMNPIFAPMKFKTMLEAALWCSNDAMSYDTHEQMRIDFYKEN